MNYIKWIAGLAIGATLGFCYWYFVGCNAGSCAITSSPINSTIYGGVMGMLLINTFSEYKTKEKSQKEIDDKSA